MLTLLAGFGTGIALIPAIGAQNAFVLRQGLRREHPVAVASFCSAADLVLIAAAIAGVGALVTRVPGLLEVIRVVGVVYLLVYAAFALQRAVRPGSLHASGRGGSLLTVLGTAAALTLLNPHLYLDVLMLGSIANAHQGDGRWLFGAGVITASVTWFFSVSLGASRLAGMFARPTAWRVLDVTVAAVMVALAVSLAVGTS
ncbi:LysE/ArgO family amino acid transporter [Pseudonocardia endophytica]|uniref:LysE/ArgO family amino acid transporter n=1 Tax=Pseudonocardia endophytica TaxID=401976 RepID=UPI001FB3A233|nr:LysE family transporter [Pseudonocardia endophytica]